MRYLKEECLEAFLDQHNAVASYIQNKLKELTRSQTISNSGDLIKNLKTLIETIGERNSDRNEVSVIFENITHRQNNTENVKEIRLESNAEQKLDCSLKNEKVKIEKLTKDQEKRLIAKFNRTNYLTHTERRELAKEMEVSEIVIKSWFQKRRNECMHTCSDRKRYKIRRDSSDSNDTVYEPCPSISYSSNKNKISCSSSSQRERSRSSDI
ncbi:homeobox protein HMX3-A-like isoform X2 [Chelonus insularis]|uniref:homeobox protein HMX3-A-like isoform X2 n=1 Tax=Chelonus insularis TaxID=460826 RepID=UPI001589DCB9|nr:homeobox protein HMX3-A-like isoform X2 [Chelonus insularis]